MMYTISTLHIRHHYFKKKSQNLTWHDLQKYVIFMLQPTLIPDTVCFETGQVNNLFWNNIIITILSIA